MEEQNHQQREREEVDMAKGPLSAGARNEDTLNPPPSEEEIRNKQTGTDQPDYDNMIRDQVTGTEYGRGRAIDKRVGSPGAGDLPEQRGSEATRQSGINMSNSTVAAGGSSGGTVMGQGKPRDRGSVPSTDLNQTTNEEELQEEKSGDQPHYL